MTFQIEKELVRSMQHALASAPLGAEAEALSHYVAPDYQWYGVHPFNTLSGAGDVASAFWTPLRQSFHRMQRREDVFFAGLNAQDGRVWTISMGHFLGLFDESWLGIPPTGRIGLVRYAEFQCVDDGKVVAGAMFCDLLGLMAQAGVYPLAPETGVYFAYPGPRTHDGVQLTEQSAADSKRTLDLIEAMIGDLSALNGSSEHASSPESMSRTWSEDMLWYGPCGIGASYTIERYQQQHQIPFRAGLADKIFNGHICRIAEGNYAGFFGWPNLTNTPTGGFLGLPGGNQPADMRVVDVYRRDGDVLAENWVFIDLPYWLLQQGLDVFARMHALQPKQS